MGPGFCADTTQVLDDCNQRLADLLWARAQELLRDQHWSWPEEVEEAAERLTNDPALALSARWATQRAVAIGYALRDAEMQLMGFTTFDDAYLAKLVTWSIDEPCMAVSAGALSVRDDLPAPFGPSAETWDELQFQAITDTKRWAAETQDAPVADLPDAVISQSVAVGYGLAYSYWAIQHATPSAAGRAVQSDPLPAALPRAAGDDGDATSAWGLAAGQAQVTAEEFMRSFRRGCAEPMNEYFPPCLHLTYGHDSRVEVLRMDWVDRDELIELLTEQIVVHNASGAALLISELDSKSQGMMPCAFRILTVGCDGHLHMTRAQIKRSRHGFPEKLRRWKVLEVECRASECMFPDYARAMLEGFVRNGTGTQIPSVVFE